MPLASMSRVMNSRKSEFSIARNNLFEITYLKTLWQHYLNSWLEKWYHSNDRDYYIQEQDLVWEDRWYSLHVKAVNSFNTSKLQLYEDEKEKCLSRAITPDRYQSEDLMKIEKCMEEYNIKLKNVMDEIEATINSIIY